MVPGRLLVREVMDYGVPMCAFHGNVTPATAGASRISNVLVRSRALSSALIPIERNLTNSPYPA
jgi:hypothetical protein